MFHSGTGGLGIVNRGIDMTKTSKLVAPALIGLAIFAYAPAYADGPGKNGDGTDIIVPAPVILGTGTGNDGGGVEGEGGKNGGGETDKNGGGQGTVVQTSTSMGAPNSGGAGGDDKNGGNVDKNGGNTPPPPPPPPPGGGNGGGKNGGGVRVVIGDRGSRGDVVDYHQITCVVNGRVFQARSTRECYRGSRSFDGGIGGGGGYGLGGGYAYKFSGHGRVGNDYGYGGRQVYRPRVRHPRVVVDGGFDGGYGYAPQPRIRYYRPASPAAVMQAERRRQRAEYAYGGSYEMDGGYGAGYAYGGGGYGFQGDMGYSDGGEYVRQRKPARKARHARRNCNCSGYGQMQGGGIGFSYDPGVVLHYGPTIVKDGGY
jgi:hypothetical protein